MFRITPFIVAITMVACINVDSTFEVDETTSDGGAGGTMYVTGHDLDHADNQPQCSGVTMPVKMYDVQGNVVVINVPIPCNPEYIPDNDGDPEPLEIKNDLENRSYPSY